MLAHGDLRDGGAVFFRERHPEVEPAFLPKRRCIDCINEEPGIIDLGKAGIFRINAGMILVWFLLIVLFYFLFYSIPVLLVAIGYSYHRRSWRWALVAIGSAIVMGYFLVSHIIESGTERITFLVWFGEFVFGFLFLGVARWKAICSGNA